jgi:hypothetical protein
VRQDRIAVEVAQQQRQGRLDRWLPVAQVEGDVQRVLRERFDHVRGEAAQEEHVARLHDDFAFDRAHATRVEIG